MKSESKRQKQVSKLLLKELASIIQSEEQAMLPNTLLTVTDVSITPGLDIARIYISIFNPLSSFDAKLALSFINAKKGKIRKELGDKIRHQLAFIPELAFYLDETQNYAAHMDELFKEIEKQEKMKNSEL